jgi:His/Glu/Gln/Arg/opine family amino acid ABC transporter permease subunit
MGGLRMAQVQAWIEGIIKDFDANLIQADRYKMILDGLGQTLIITFFAAIFGIIIGAIIALMRLSHTKIGRWHVLRGIASFYVDVVRGTPIVVQLMIIYFVIMVTYRGPKTIVAIVAFSINSGAYVSEMIRSGILAIDKGQTEAGRSLGLSKAATMWLIVMPQAFKIILPTLFNEFVMLLKETSVVGYIGLMDLTKSGDYIRSRTFSAFFPLITVAFIYYVIVSGFTRVFARLERRIRQGDQH